MEIEIAHNVTVGQTDFHAHCHNHYEILLCVAGGKNNFVIEGARFPMRPMQLFFCRERQYHFVEPDEKSRYERYIVNFTAENTDLGEEELESLFSAHGKSAAGQPEILQLLQKMLRFSKEEEPKRRILLRGALNELLYLLCDLSPGARGEGSPLVLELTAYIGDHLGENLSLSALSAALFADKFHLCHVFQREMGTGILQYVQKKRVKTAESLIRSGVRPTAAAERVGYEDYSAFYRAYRRVLGKTPASDRT